MGKKTKKKDSNNISNNLLKFPKKITNNDTKKYELINIVSKTGDSIYCTTLPFEKPIIDGQIFIAESKIEEIVNRIIDEKLETSKK